MVSVACSQLITEGTVYFSPVTGWTVKIGVMDSSSGSAWGQFADTVQTTGWSTLRIQTNENSPDREQAYAAGYLEGCITRDYIYNSRQNVGFSLFNGSTTPPSQVSRFLKEQDEFMKAKIVNFTKDSFWIQADLIYQQLQGMIDGYSNCSDISKALSREDFLIVNAAGDLLDIVPAVVPQLRPNFSQWTPSQVNDYVQSRQHCTALVKVLSDLSTIYFAHTTWSAYEWMLRIYKFYEFPMKNSSIKSKKVSFSSYPGALSSVDDYYLLDSGLAVMETTNSILKTELYDDITPKTVLTWTRVIIANRISDKAKDWTEVFSTLQSGTYNNQWMVLDWKNFSPNKTIAADTLWIVEQAPLLSVSSDVSSYLGFGYWPSYNVPYNEFMYNYMGYPDFYEKYGDLYSYGHCPRANILRRDNGKITNIEDMKSTMRYNDFQHDPYSLGDPTNSLCARKDLRSQNPIPDGGTDAKVTSYELSSTFQSWIVSGPTTQGQPPFSWDSPLFKGYSHLGQPETFNFDWMMVDPNYY